MRVFALFLAVLVGGSVHATAFDDAFPFFQHLDLPLDARERLSDLCAKSAEILNVINSFHVGAMHEISTSSRTCSEPLSGDASVQSLRIVMLIFSHLDPKSRFQDRLLMHFAKLSAIPIHDVMPKHEERLTRIKEVLQAWYDEVRDGEPVLFHGHFAMKERMEALASFASELEHQGMAYWSFKDFFVDEIPDDSPDTTGKKP